MFNWSLSQEMEKYKKLKVVTEAPEDTEINTGVINNEAEAEEMGSTDYDAAAAEMDDANQDGTADEGTESAENDVEDMEADDYTEGEEGTEDTGEEGGDDLEADDYTEGEEGTEEELPEEEPVPEENGDKSKNRFLVREYIQLYYDVENIIKKLNNNHKTSLVRSEIYLQVSNNLTDMNNMLFEYIKNDFSHKSYLFNLYQFNLFLEFINVNAEIMAKCNELQSNEQTNK